MYGLCIDLMCRAYEQILSEELCLDLICWSDVQISFVGLLVQPFDDFLLLLLLKYFDLLTLDIF